MQWLLYLLVIFGQYLNRNVNAEYVPMSTDSEEDLQIYEKYVELDRNLKDFVEHGLELVLPYIKKAKQYANISTNCENEFNLLHSEIRNLKLSSVKMVDAMGKLQAGLLTGTFSMLGDYDECMTTTVSGKDNDVAFKGQYCLVSIKVILPKKKRIVTIDGGLEELVDYTKNTSEVTRNMVRILQAFYDHSAKFGLCAPSGCNTEELNGMLSYLEQYSVIRAKIEYCDQQGEKKYYVEKTIAIFSFVLIGIVSVIGSSMDYYAKKKGITYQNICAKILVCFSIPANFPKLISAKTSDTSMTSLFGIRCLSLFYIILLHRYLLMGDFQNIGHALREKDRIPQFFPQIFINGFLIVEVFFLLSGLLNGYYRMSLFENTEKKFNSFQAIIYRLWRLLPTYIFCLMTAFLIIDISGPLASFDRERHGKNCLKYWWRNFLFINNFWAEDDACLFQSWYLSADMQLFLISLFTMAVFPRNLKKNVILHLGVICIGLLTSIVWAWHKDITPTIIAYQLELNDAKRFRNAYLTPMPHIAPYFTGVIVGFILHKWKKIKIPPILQVLGWIAASACFVSMLFVTQKWNSGAGYTLFESAMYFSFSRLLIALSVAWMIVCCCRGYAGFINYILSLKIWIPLSRLSYMMYLISPIMQEFFFARSRMLIDGDNMTVIWLYMGDLAISGLASLAMVVVIESPFISMQKLVWKRDSPKEKGDSESNKSSQPISVNNDEFDKEKDIEMEKNLKNSVVNF